MTRLTRGDGSTILVPSSMVGDFLRKGFVIASTESREEAPIRPDDPSPISIPFNYMSKQQLADYLEERGVEVLDTDSFKTLKIKAYKQAGLDTVYLEEKWKKCL